MTSTLIARNAVPLVRKGKPLSAKTVNRTIARVRREHGLDNLVAHPQAIAER